MRLICPHCMSGVTVPDDTAGKEAVCTNCGKSFPTPPRYPASVVPDPAPAAAGSLEPARSTPHPDSPADNTPPPGYVPPEPASDGSGFLPTAPAQTPTPGGYTKSRGITFRPDVALWLPALFLTAALLLTFFPWVGSYFGGHAIYSQGPGSAMVGATNPNTGLESVAPPHMVGWSKKASSDWLLMVPFLLTLLLATLLALLDRALGSGATGRVPPLAKVWPHRHTVIAILAVVALSLVVIQSLTGFRIERSARQTARESPAVVKEREEAQGIEWKLARADYYAEQELKRFDLERTIWMHLAVLCLALGTLAAIGAILLERRGNKPPPKLLLHY
jgi:hypothetical protein